MAGLGFWETVLAFTLASVIAGLILGVFRKLNIISISDELYHTQTNRGSGGPHDVLKLGVTPRIRNTTANVKIVDANVSTEWDYYPLPLSWSNPDSGNVLHRGEGDMVNVFYIADSEVRLGRMNENHSIQGREGKIKMEISTSTFPYSRMVILVGDIDDIKNCRTENIKVYVNRTII